MTTGLLSDAFDRGAAATPTRPAVVERGRTLTYGELLDASGRVTAALASSGVARGDRVGLMIPNSAAFVAGYFGIVRAGAVVAPLNVRYRSQELVYYVNDTQATALLVAPGVLDTAAEALEGLDNAPALFEVTEDCGCRRAAPGRGSAAPRPGGGGGGSPALMHQYTSGSTGDPKRVVRTHANLLFELETLAATFSLSADDRFLGAAPFSHVNGLVRTMLTSMFVGGTLYPMPAFDRRGALDVIRGERLTYFGAVPYMFILLADSPVRGDVNLSSLRTAFSASAPLLPADNRRFHSKYGVWVRQLYGSTETGTISVNRHDDPETCLESVGTPLEGVRVEVIGADGRPLAAGQEGEVAIASPAAIRGYEGNPEANAASFVDGFYRSGDLGQKAADGCLTLTGRTKFLINRGGFKVNPLEVEAAIQEHAKVREVAVYGAPSAHGDDVVRCAVVSNGPCTPEEILAHCRSRIADYKIPSRVDFMDALPKSETGKLLRHKLVEREH